jgi:LmbE family N-acetylglucosaminyl deacetylase
LSALEPLPEDWERALAIVAHPDDLEYGAASAIARWTAQGKQVTYLLATHGEAGIDTLAPDECARVREAEERASATEVGVHEVTFLDHVDGLVEYGIPLRRDFALAIRRQRPHVVITLNHRDSWGPGSFNMADHRNVGLAVIDAVRDAGNRWVFTGADGLDPWNGVRMVLVSGSPEPTHFVDVTATLERGIASLEQHAAYLAHVGQDARQFLTSSAAGSGQQCGVPYAATFEVLAL